MKKEGETRAFGETFGALLGDCEVLLDGTHSHAKSYIFRVGQSSGEASDHFFRVRGTKASPKGSRGALGELFFIFCGFWGSWEASFFDEIEFWGRLFCESVSRVISGAVERLGAGGSGALDGGGSLRNPG